MDRHYDGLKQTSKPLDMWFWPSTPRNTNGKGLDIRVVGLKDGFTIEDSLEDIPGIKEGKSNQPMKVF